MTADMLPAWLRERQGAGMRLGLDRVRAALDELGGPQERVPAILVGGTNGKGSVAAILDAALRAEGCRTGLYTSPHLVSPADRIRLDGEPISHATLEAGAEAVRVASLRHDLTFFESFTVLAFHVFAQRLPEVAILEVGLGGRLDATNVVEPLLSVVTSVSIDHVRELGNTVERIAAEKAGIFRPGVPVLSAAEGAADPVLSAEAARVGADFHRLGSHGRLEAIRIDRSGTRFTIRTDSGADRTVRTSLIGAHQARNAWTAMEAAALLPARLRPDPGAVERGLQDVRWPGRIDLRRDGGRHLLLDVAHNPAGIEALVATMADLCLPRPWVAVVGICADKPWARMLDTLAPAVDAAILTVAPSIPSARRWDPDAAVAALGPEMRLRAIPDLDSALERSVTMAPHGTVVICGSTFTVGDSLRRLPPRVPAAVGLPA